MCFESITPPFGEIVIFVTQIGKTLIFANLLISFNLCPLICSFLTLHYFIRFSMNTYLKTSRCDVFRRQVFFDEHVHLLA